MLNQRVLVKFFILGVLCASPISIAAQTDTSLVQVSEHEKKSFWKRLEMKKEAPIYLMLFIAGAADGLSQDLLFHYPEFERFSGATNEQYWNPELSWRNKYKDGDPENGAKFFGSTTFLVGLTDGYHASRSLRDTMIILSLATSPKETSKKDIVKKAFIYTICYGSGFTLVYDYLIK